MYIESKVFANYFKVEKANTDKSIYGTISVAIEVGEQDGEKKYEYDYWPATFVGKCLEDAKNLNNKDKITLTKFRIRNHYNGEKNFPSITVFGFERRE